MCRQPGRRRQGDFPSSVLEEGPFAQDFGAQAAEVTLEVRLAARLAVSDVAPTEAVDVVAPEADGSPPPQPPGGGP